MMCKLEVLSYEDSRRKFFIDKLAEAERKLKYWEKRAAGTLYLSKEHYWCNEYGSQVCYYRDALDALERKETVE